MSSLLALQATERRPVDHDRHVRRAVGTDVRQIEPLGQVVIDLNGEVIEGSRNPSVEWQMHLELYNNRSIAGAVVHTHSIYASAMAVLNESLPPIIDITFDFFPWYVLLVIDSKKLPKK